MCIRAIQRTTGVSRKCSSTANTIGSRNSRAKYNVYMSASTARSSTLADSVLRVPSAALVRSRSGVGAAGSTGVA